MVTGKINRESRPDGGTEVRQQWGASSRHVAPGDPQQAHQGPECNPSSQAQLSHGDSDDESGSDGSPGLSDCIPSSTSASIHDHSLSSAKNSNVKSSNGSTNGVTKDSRYLREMDRRDILHRIKQGEKQSALAKEYNISRSAVCNLNKKRVAVLARKCDNPLAKHPKLNRRAAVSKAAVTHLNGTVECASEGRPTQDAVAVVHVARGDMVGRLDAHSVTQQLPAGGLYVLKLTQRAVGLLLSRIQDRATSESDFRHCADRLMRLLLEEAMALVQLRVVEITSNHHESIGTSSAETHAGVIALHPTCALSLEQDGCPMLDFFNLLEPDLPTGYVRISSSMDHTFSPSLTTPAMQANLSATVLRAHLPRDLAQFNVLLLDTVVDSGEAVCCAIEQVIVQLGAVEKRISVIMLFISSDAIEKVMGRYPHVRIVAADGGWPRSLGVELAARNEPFRQRLKRVM
ncbi:hypothetical protein Gpo141_00013193 [Globisporangium polare]